MERGENLVFVLIRFYFIFFNFKNIAVPVLLCTDDSLYKLMGSLGSSSQFAIQVISI